MNFLFSPELRESMGGVVAIGVEKISDITFWPNMAANKFLSKIQLGASFAFETLFPVKGMAQFNEVSEDTDNGTIYRSQLQNIVRGYDTTTAQLFPTFTDNVILLVVFANGHCVVMGDYRRPVKVTTQSQTGRLASESNELAFTAEHTSHYPCHFYPFI